MSRDLSLLPIVDQFPIYESDGYTKKSGETTFTKRIWKDGVVSGVTVSVTEIGTSGEYKVGFTPDGYGFWEVEILIDYNKDIFHGEYDVSPENAESLFNAAYDDDSSTLYMEAWLERNGQAIDQASLVSCQIDVYKQDGTLLTSETSSSPRSNGRFSFSKVISLTDDRPYNVTVAVTDNASTVTTYHAFSTAHG